MKYEAVLGNQDLFDGASKYAVIAIKRPSISGVRSEEMHFFSSTFDAVMKAGSSFNFNNVILKTAEYAERSIIQEPKRWTVEDQKAGRLPKVGNHLLIEGDLAEFIGLSHAPNSWCFRRLDGEWGIQTANKDWFSPIETPEEKAERLEDEFVNELMKDGQVIYTSSEQLAMCRKTARAAYRKLSGALSAPTKGGE